MPYFTPEKKEHGRFVNLFTDKALLNRTCEEIGISPFDCSCLVLEEIRDIEDNAELYRLARVIIEEALHKMNSLVNTPLAGDYQLCEKMTYRSIISAYGLMLNNKVEELQLKFAINENFNAIFEAFAFVGSDKRSTVLVPTNQKGTTYTYVYRGYGTRIKIFGIKRKDTYAGPCEDLTRKLQIKSEYCLCKSHYLQIYNE